MRALLTSLTILSVVSLSSGAFAASTTTGTIRALDTKAMTLTLKDGTRYAMPAGFKEKGLKAGEKVTIAYEMIGKTHQATAITPAQ